MITPNRILIVASSSKDADWLVSLLAELRDNEFDITSAVTTEQNLDTDRLRSDVLVLDTSLGTERTQHLLHDLMLRRKSVPVVLCIDREQSDEFSNAVRHGAQDFIIKGKDSAEVVYRVLLHALDRSSILRATEESEERIRTIIENISDGILIVDEAETILFVNPACEDLLNRPLIELLGAPLGIEIPAASSAVVEIKHSADYTIAASLRWVPIRWEGRDVRLYTIRDISAEHEVRLQLKLAKEEAERLATLKSSFLANMSHELRMPLASIIGFAQLIEEGVDNEDFKEFAGMISESGNRLLETINSVLDLTRLDAQAFEMRRKRLSVGTIVREVADALKPLLDDKMLPVVVLADEDDWLKADPVVLGRIFNNLIGNAIKFTDSGEITVTVTGSPESLQCVVADTGVGIDPSFIPHVFDEFAQESIGRSRTHEGTGLGLAITQRLVQSMGGTITVSSEKDKGSTFTVVFPRSISKSDES